MLNKRIAIPVAIATVATAATIGIATAFASTPEGAKAFGLGWLGQGMESASRAFDSNDYPAWKEAVQAKVAEFTSQEKFDQLRQLQQLRQDGKYDEAANLAQTLGLPGRKGRGAADKQEMKQAIESGDFAAWKTAMENRLAEKQQHLGDLSGKINEDTFNKMVTAHKLRQEGKQEEARAIMEELGMPAGRGGHGRGNGW